jgi:lipid-binding SYLF domain-containing protein
MNTKRVLAAALGLTFLFAGSAGADDKAERQEVVNAAQATLSHFARDPEMDWMRKNFKDAKAVLVVPRLMRGAFILGASGGSGVLLGRDAAPDWSYPAFYTMGSVSFGLQAGGDFSEVVLMAMTQKGKEAMLSDSFKLGADISVAAGPVGAGAKAATADILAFSRAKGVYGGVSFDGSVISTRDSWNHGYYGKVVTPVDIVVSHKVRNPEADALRRQLATLAQGK